MRPDPKHSRIIGGKKFRNVRRAKLGLPPEPSDDRIIKTYTAVNTQDELDHKKGLFARMVVAGLNPADSYMIINGVKKEAAKSGSRKWLNDEYVMLRIAEYRMPTRKAQEAAVVNLIEERQKALAKLAMAAVPAADRMVEISQAAYQGKGSIHPAIVLQATTGVLDRIGIRGTGAKFDENDADEMPELVIRVEVTNNQKAEAAAVKGQNGASGAIDVEFEAVGVGSGPSSDADSSDFDTSIIGRSKITHGID